MIRAVGLAAVAGFDVAVLAHARPRFGQLARDVGAPHAWLRSEGADHVLVSLASAAIWFAAIWLACCLFALAATALPGGAGRIARRASRRLLPRAVHRLVAGSAGLGILIAPVAAGATASTGHVPAGLAATALPSPTWPVDPPGRSIPAPDWPATPRDDAPRPRAPEEIRVHPGDSLWVIAERRLGPRASPEHVARSWPRWYAANRRVIGADPDLIEPGQVLRSPADRP